MTRHDAICIIRERQQRLVDADPEHEEMRLRAALDVVLGTGGLRRNKSTTLDEALAEAPREIVLMRMSPMNLVNYAMRLEAALLHVSELCGVHVTDCASHRLVSGGPATADCDCGLVPDVSSLLYGGER
jgi:hypothetical protein